MNNKLKRMIKRLLSCIIFIVCLITVAFFALRIYGYKADKGVIITYGDSLIYSHEDIDKAVTEVEKDFSKMKGCKLYSLTYAGDEKGKDELESYNRDLPEEERVQDCIVFNSVFRSPLLGGGAWEAHAIYTWNWIVVRDENGQWKVVNKGYA